MKKLIAKTQTGTEFLHSKTNAFFATETSAQKIADILNKNNYQLKENELWHVYDFDYTQDFYVDKRIYLYKGSVKAKYI
jgi:polysaccharide pyruvyl transferase WcaK-like protein